MQEQKASKSVLFVERLGRANLIWVSVSCALLLGALVMGMRLYKDLPTAQWRQSATPLPWQAQGISVTRAEGRWQSSKGNPRMELRALYYPLARIEIGELQGSGSLLIRFTDSNGLVRGGAISIPYANGALVDRRESNVKIQGKSIDAYAETGFASKEEALLHNLSEQSALWRFSIWIRPEGSEDEQFVGYACIPPTPHKP